MCFLIHKQDQSLVKILVWLLKEKETKSNLTNFISLGDLKYLSNHAKFDVGALVNFHEHEKPNNFHQSCRDFNADQLCLKKFLEIINGLQDIVGQRWPTCEIYLVFHKK